MRDVYADQRAVSVDFLLVCFLSVCGRFGRFTFGPISLECRVVEEEFERTYLRLSPGEPWGTTDESAERFYRRVAAELTSSGSRRVDELHWLLAFMRTTEGLPVKVFGELGAGPEEVERFARLKGSRSEESRLPREKLFTPEEVAEYLGVHVQTVRVWIRNGKLPARKLAGQRALRIRESDLESVLEPVGFEEANDNAEERRK